MRRPLFRSASAGARAFALAVSVLLVPACGGGARQAVGPERLTAAADAVGEDAFPGAVHDLLVADPRSAVRRDKLAGVVARQLARAHARFSARDRDRGLRAFVGAMYLVRAGELRAELLGGPGVDTVREASDELARRGDDGRARATYELLGRIGSEKERADAKLHLQAIQAWARDTAGAGPTQSAGSLANHAARRQLLEPSDEARTEATQRTVEWIDRAVQLRNAYRQRRAAPAREEANEAVRALGTGPAVLAAIHLRHADAAAALAALDKGSVREVARPELLAMLEAVAQKPTSAKWLSVARNLRARAEGRGEPQGEDEEIPVDRELLEAASFVSAQEAYRLDPSSPDAAALLAVHLVELGMEEAAPAVLREAAGGAHPDPRVLSVALGITLRAMVELVEGEDIPGARRAFAAAAPLLAAGDASGDARVQPSPARLRATMGEIELRDGELGRARALLEAAGKAEPMDLVTFQLARLDAHEGKGKAALAGVDAILAKPAPPAELPLRAEMQLFAADRLREEGKDAEARKRLVGTAEELGRSRKGLEGDALARVERVLARVLDRLAATKLATAALDRSYDAARRDKRQLAATVSHLVARALVANDVASARDGLARGLASELGREDLVYCAAWVRLLERAPGVTPSDLTDRVLVPAADDPRWIGRVAAFAVGKLSADDFQKAARSPAQRAEATFYVAMTKRVAGDAKADAALREVVASPGLDLLEHWIAQELLAGKKAQLPGPPPNLGT